MFVRFTVAINSGGSGGFSGVSKLSDKAEAPGGLCKLYRLKVLVHSMAWDNEGKGQTR